MTLDIDRLLSEDAETWQSGLPADEGPAALLHDSRGPRSHGHRLLAIAASAAVVLVAAGVVLAVHRASSTRTESVGPHFSGPCQDNFTVAPTVLRPPPPLPSGDLQLTATYRGSSSCRVSVYGPSLVLRDASGSDVGFGSHSTLELIEPDFLVVRPGDSLALVIRLYGPCTGSLRVATVILHMGGRGDPADVGVSVPLPATYRPRCGAYPAQSFGGFVELPKLIRADR